MIRARMQPRLLALSLLALAVLAACGTVPQSSSGLDNARTSYREAQADPNTRELAAPELKQAGDALAAADAAFDRRDSNTEVEHLAYVARQRVHVAHEVAIRRRAEASVAGATAARDQVRLAARTRQAEAAERSAEAAQRDAAESQRQVRLSQQQSAQAQQQSAAAQQQTRDAESRAAVLQALLTELNAKKTERGMVITIGDVLFDTSRDSLKPDGRRNLDRLVDLLRQYPDRRVAIEGFTDSTGSSSGNLELSDRRARSVRTALLDQGVGAERLSTLGLGELHPVASNDSADGRQLNRRVEIVLSDDSGRVRPR